MKFIARWLVTAIAVAAAVWLVPGITIIGDASSDLTAVCAVGASALALALVNMFIKPVVKVLSCPLAILTLGLFYLVVNAAMLELAAWAGAGMFGIGIAIDSFGSAVVGSIIISIVSMLVNGFIKSNDQQK